MRVVLFGPSLDLPSSRRLSWLEREIRKLRLRPNSDILVGVDGGALYLEKLGLLPRFKTGFKTSFVTGDWDSLPGGLRALARFRREGVRVLTLPRKKDRSDLCFAFRAVGRVSRRAAVSETLLFGFTGGRPDQHLASLLEISRFAAAHSQKTAAISPEGEYHFITPKHPCFRPRCRPGAVISFFALNGVARGVSMKGFEYNLRDQDLRPSSRGLSNVVRARAAGIRVSGGVLLGVIPRAR